MFVDITSDLILPCILLFLIVFCFGIIIGSFLNVCIYRLPKGESLITNASHCMTCGERIKPYDLIPLFSWIFLKGKCRHCGEKISGRYPLVEFLNGIMWVFAFVKFEFTIKAVVFALFFSALIVVGFMDWDTQEINLGVLMFIGLLSIPAFFFDKLPLTERLIGLVAISVPLFIIGFVITPFIYRNKSAEKVYGFGMGDIYLMAGGGLFLGYKAVIVASFIGIILGGFYGMIKKRTVQDDSLFKFAFGPWLSIGLAVAAFFGTGIFDWYIRFLG